MNFPWVSATNLLTHISLTFLLCHIWDGLNVARWRLMSEVLVTIWVLKVIMNVLYDIKGRMFSQVFLVVQRFRWLSVSYLECGVLRGLFCGTFLVFWGCNCWFIKYLLRVGDARGVTYRHRQNYTWKFVVGQETLQYRSELFVVSLEILWLNPQLFCGWWKASWRTPKFVWMALSYANGWKVLWLTRIFL